MAEHLRFFGFLILFSFVFVQCQEVSDDIDLDAELLSAIANAAENGQAAYYILPDESDLASIPNQDPHNPLTPAKVKLGRMLFFETGLAQVPFEDVCFETYSCSSCHLPEKGFLPGRMQGIADGAEGYGIHGKERLKLPNYLESELDAQGLRPLSPLNVTYVTNTLWSGIFGAKGVNEGTEEYWTDSLSKVNFTGYIGLEAQNIEGLHLHRMKVNDRVLDVHGYRKYFDLAFWDFPESERYTEETASFAIGAYLRTLLTNQAPFQKYLKGDANALTESQKEGAKLFFGKARCFHCHHQPNLGSMEFHALGVSDLYEIGGLNTSEEDRRILGRAAFTGQESDRFRFRVPGLYNVKDYATYFHGSSKTTLEEVVTFKVEAKSENKLVPDNQLSGKFRPLDLSPAEQTQLVDFLRNGLHDANMMRHVPRNSLSGGCIPNNDQRSKQDLGCE